jgi:hypothetical protein
MRITILLLLTLALTVLGCDDSTGPAQTTVTVRTVHSATLEYHPNFEGTTITASITNYTADSVEAIECESTPFNLEVCRDGSWQQAFPSAFDCLPLFLPVAPGMTHYETYTLYNTGWLKTGVYRLTAGIFPVNGREHFLVASNPFTLVVEPAPAQ